MARYHHRATLPALLVCFFLAVGLLFFAWHQWRTRTTLPPNANLSRIGVELNQQQGVIDLQQLKKHGIDFVYLRSTQGRSYFDDNYDLYRDQLQGGLLPFGTVVYFSNQSTVRQQLAFFERKVGRQSGELPVMVVPAAADRSDRYLQAMSRFAAQLEQAGRSVVVSDACPRKFLPAQTQRLLTSRQLKLGNRCAFWRYTQNGRVKNMPQLSSQATMYAYLGDAGEFDHLYERNLIR